MLANGDQDGHAAKLLLWRRDMHSWARVLELVNEKLIERLPSGEYPKKLYVPGPWSCLPVWLGPVCHVCFCLAFCHHFAFAVPGREPRVSVCVFACLHVGRLLCPPVRQSICAPAVLCTYISAPCGRSLPHRPGDPSARRPAGTSYRAKK